MTEPPAKTSPFPAPAESIVARLALGGPTVVALSGGVDSGSIALLAHEALGRQAWAVTLTGPSVSARESKRAAEVARSIGIQHAQVEVNPLQSERYRANPANRCYFCRVTETRALKEWGSDRGIVQYVDGVHVDDLGDLRPGLRAMDEAGFLHPFVDAGWRKSTVRAFAQSRGLPNWDEPSDACLASRVRHDQPLSRDLLDQVARSEAWFHALGFRRVRVRVDGSRARVEVDPGEVPRLLDPGVSAQARQALSAYGFSHVELDPHGYRSRPGS